MLSAPDPCAHSGASMALGGCRQRGTRSWFCGRSRQIQAEAQRQGPMGAGGQLGHTPWCTGMCKACPDLLTAVRAAWCSQRRRLQPRLPAQHPSTARGPSASPRCCAPSPEGSSAQRAIRNRPDAVKDFHGKKSNKMWVVMK